MMRHNLSDIRQAYYRPRKFCFRVMECEHSEVLDRSFDYFAFFRQHLKELIPSGEDAGEVITGQNIHNVLQGEAAILTAVLLRLEFFIDGITFSIDGMVRNGDSVELHFLRLSSTVKGRYLEETALIAHLLSFYGINVTAVIFHSINRNYHFSGIFSIKDYFVPYDVTGQVKKLRPLAAEMISLFRALRNISVQEEIFQQSCKCSSPVSCGYFSQCYPGFPEHNVFTLHHSGILSRELAERGIFQLTDIPLSEDLSDKQRIQIEAVKTGEHYFDKKRLDKFLGKVKMPVSYIDFEALNSPVYFYSGTRPWQHVPFQFSLHIDTGSSLEHYIFTAPPGEDPRPLILKELESMLPQYGSIIVYNKIFESRIFRELYEFGDLPGNKISVIENRMLDLAQVFTNFYYYHPGQKGRMSLKTIAPLLTDLSYSNTIVNDGADAHNLYADLCRNIEAGGVTQKESARIIDELEKYCTTDTLALHHILEYLRRLCK